MAKEISGVRRFWRDLGLAVGLACVAALVALALGVRGPTVLAVGAVTGFTLFAVLQWGDKIAVRIGYPESPVSMTWRWPRWHPPMWAGKRKMRKETEALVRDIHEFLKTQPAWMAKNYAEDQDFEREFQQEWQKPLGQDERQALWERKMARSLERSEQSRQELVVPFGGRVRYVLGECVRRGLLSDSEARQHEWQLSSRFHIAFLATALDALARRL